MHEYLASVGVTVASLEQRGFGQSIGTANLAKWPADIAAVGDWLRGQGLRVWSSGISTGGTLALTAAGQYEWFAGAIALSPFTTLRMIRRDYPPCYNDFPVPFRSFVEDLLGLRHRSSPDDRRSFGTS